jgi:hypothetical protein
MSNSMEMRNNIVGANEEGVSRSSIYDMIYMELKFASTEHAKRAIIHNRINNERRK